MLFSHDVNIKRIRFTFTLREIFDVAHYNISAEEFVKIWVFKSIFEVYSKPIFNLSTQIYIVQIKYVFVQKRLVDTFFHFSNTKIVLQKQSYKEYCITVFSMSLALMSCWR